MLFIKSITCFLLLKFLFKSNILTEKVIEKLAHYEDMEEQGRLIEQKHGTWEIHDEYYFCTNCYSEWKEIFTYCPCCGSKNGEAETDLLKELEE